MRPGAVSTASEPRLKWVSMLCRPENSTTKKIFALASKFNRILGEVISGDKRSHLLKPNVDLHGNSVNFNRSGNLTPNGVTQYWKDIDAQMKEFD